MTRSPIRNPESDIRNLLLSVCMIVKNEADLLRRCLESVAPVADEMVVVDTGSQDETIAVAKECGARVVQSAWRDDFSFSRNVSIEHASGRWILWLDADDVVPAESLDELHRLKKTEPDRVCAFTVRNQKPGGIGSVFVQARMFPNRPELRFERRVHEQIMPSALRIGLTMVREPVVVEHHGYASAEQMARKARRNVTLLIEDYRELGPEPVAAVEIADSYTILDEADNAEKWYRHVLEIPDVRRTAPAIVSQALFGLGNLLNRQERFIEAVAALEDAFSACARPDVLYSLAVAQEESTTPERAVETLGGVLEFKAEAMQVGVDFRQTRIKAILRLARLLGDLGREQELTGLVERALREHSDRPEIHNLAGSFLLTHGQLMEALRCYEKSLQIAVEGNLDAYIGLCVIYSMAGRSELARQTADSIGEAFGGWPRYRAFRRLLFAEPVEEQEREAVEAEIAYLRKTFGLTT